MPYAIKLLSWANGTSLQCAGEYVRTVDVQMAAISYDWLTTTPNLREAFIWQSRRGLLKTYNEVLAFDPVRSDGRPNKPMTALNIEIIPVKKEELT